MSKNNLRIPEKSVHHNSLVEEYLYKLDKFIGNNIHKNNETNNRVAVIVEPRQHNLLGPIIKNVMYFLNDYPKLKHQWNLHIFGGTNNKDYIDRILPNWKYEFTCLGMENITADDHNILLRQTFFWNQIREEHILIFQTDSFMFRPLNDDFLKYNFCGASILNYMARTPKNIGMNGGFSLRRRSSMLECCKYDVKTVNKYRKFHDKPEIPNEYYMAEDIYFWHILEYLNKDMLPMTKTIEFSIEAPPLPQEYSGDIFEIKPTGIHAFNKNMISLNILKKLINDSNELLYNKPTMERF